MCSGSTVPNQAAGVFWAVVSGLLVIFQSIILICASQLPLLVRLGSPLFAVSEIGWPTSFFNRFFPVLGSEFGVGALGVFQCLIGAQILSHFVDGFTLVAAFFTFSIGCINILLGLVMRETVKSKRSIAEWQNNSKPILPIMTKDITKPVFVNTSPTFMSRKDTGASFARSNSTGSMDDEKIGYGFGRQGEKAAGLRGFYLQRPEESLPRYASPTPSSSQYTQSAPSTPPQPTVTLPATQPLTLAPSQKSAALASALARNKSVRTSTSSFASPGDYNNNSDDLYATDDEDESIYESRPVTPIPTYIASPHETPYGRGRGNGSRPVTPPMFKSSTTSL